MQLIASDLCHSFGARHVFEHLDFEIDPGEAVAVVGPSGAGKSTLLAVMSGLLAPSGGDITMRTHERARRPIPQLCAWVPQGANALGSRNAVDNVIIGALALGTSRHDARERAERALEEVGLSPLANAPAMSMSGGELQRLAVARAMVQDRPFIFADEPTGSLDITNSRHVADVLCAATASGASVIIATHDPDVWSRCDRTIHLVS